MQRPVPKQRFDLQGVKQGRWGGRTGRNRPAKASGAHRVAENPDADRRLELKRQLEPHFLFNSLASISGALPDDAFVARKMIDELAEFCRLSLKASTCADWCALSEELDLLRAYLAVEMARWGDGLAVEMVCPAELAQERIPPLLLLPLVENALKYGRATCAERLILRIVARSDGEDLVVEVVNSGRWVDNADSLGVPSLGVGLENVRARLADYFPRRHTLEHGSEGGWVKVALRLRPATGPAC